MRGERGRRVEELFAAALELDERERGAWLVRETAGDTALHDEVQSMLAHFDPDTGFLSRPPLHAAEAEPRLPERIGTFRIVSLLGEGGMGRVYLAEQDSPRRLVALKVLRAAFAAPRDIRRFEHEADLLARLHHPGIAQVYEAGTTEAGGSTEPFLAMELVHGPTIVAYADEHALDLRARLRLVAEVCDAVEHAHRRGIVHRDVKPSNVLVDESSGAPQVKILDFGIARATDPEAQPTSALTITGQVVGTLPYMSPEQAGADPSAVDARSDVYSLGVLAYELVCGRLPLELAGKPLHEALRIVREDEPAAPSRISARLAGDIETILTKALEKDPSRRYDTAAELAADLRAFLEHRPIRARPPSRVYTLRKFARRNRALVGGIVSVFAALVLGLATTIWQAQRATEERDRASVEAGRAREAARRAESEARRARAVAKFQREMLARVQPDQDGRDVRLATVLDAAAAALPGELADDPAAEGGVHKTLGDSYHALGLLTAAEREFAAARELLVRGLGEAHEESIDTLGWQGTTAADLGRFEAAIEYCERARADAFRHLGAQSRTGLVIEMNLAQLYVLVGREAEAEPIARENVARRAAAFGEEDPDTLAGVGMLADLLLMTGRNAEAEPLLRRVLAANVRERGEENSVTLSSMGMLGYAIFGQGRLDEPEQLFRRVLEIGARVLGEDHIELQAARNNLAVILEKKGNAQEAEALLRAALAVNVRTLGHAHPDSIAVLNSLVMLLARAGRVDGARAEVEAARVALKSAPASGVRAGEPVSAAALDEIVARLDALR